MDPAGTVHAAETAALHGPPVYRRPWAAAVDRAIGVVVEPLAAFLVVVEVVILSAGVFTRYVLGNPLVWSDELATIVFLWLAMLGAVVAYRRGEHIALTVLVRRGMKFNDVDKNSFKQKLAEAKYYERWRDKFGPKAWAALEKYANKLA